MAEQLLWGRGIVSRLNVEAQCRWLKSSEATSILSAVAAALTILPTTQEPVAGTLCLTLRPPKALGWKEDSAPSEDGSYHATLDSDGGLQRRSWSAAVRGPWLMQFMRIDGGPRVAE